MTDRILHLIEIACIIAGVILGIIGYMSTSRTAKEAIDIAKKSYALAEQTAAKPEFEIVFEQAIPPDPIFSQKAHPKRILPTPPSPDIYDKANKDKTNNKENRITITNVGKVPSPVTYVEIAVDDPFSLALISVHVPGIGWFNSLYSKVEKDKLDHQKTTIQITMPISQGEKLEIYPAIVYAKAGRKRYLNQDEISDSLTVKVHSSVNPSLATGKFSLKF